MFTYCFRFTHGSVCLDLYTMQPAAGRLSIKSVVCGATHGAKRPCICMLRKGVDHTLLVYIVHQCDTVFCILYCDLSAAFDHYMYCIVLAILSGIRVGVSMLILETWMLLV
jgi:hypothetical protein